MLILCLSHSQTSRAEVLSFSYNSKPQQSAWAGLIMTNTSSELLSQIETICLWCQGFDYQASLCIVSMCCMCVCSCACVCVYARQSSGQINTRRLPHKASSSSSIGDLWWRSSSRNPGIGWCCCLHAAGLAAHAWPTNRSHFTVEQEQEQEKNAS